MRILVALVVLLAVAAAVALAVLGVRLYAGGEANGKAADGPRRAGSALVVISGAINKDGVGEMNAIRVTSPEKVAALEAFFPGYHRQPASRLAGGWEMGYEVYFDFPNGKSFRVVVSENEDAHYWTMGRGDFETQGDFKSFMADLQR